MLKALLGMTLLIVYANVISTEPIIIRAEPGQTVTLPCQAPDKEPVNVLDWIRADPKTDGHVLLYRDKKFQTDYQHPSYKNRVDLKEGWKTNGDVSLTLNNVTTNDSGKYECHVKGGTKKTELIIKLQVVHPGDKDGGDKDGGAKSGRTKSGGDKSGGDKNGSLLVCQLLVLLLWLRD